MVTIRTLKSQIFNTLNLYSIFFHHNNMLYSLVHSNKNTTNNSKIGVTRAKNSTAMHNLLRKFQQLYIGELLWRQITIIVETCSINYASLLPVRLQFKTNHQECSISKIFKLDISYNEIETGMLKHQTEI